MWSVMISHSEALVRCRDGFFSFMESPASRVMDDMAAKARFPPTGSHRGQGLRALLGHGHVDVGPDVGEHLAGKRAPRGARLIFYQTGFPSDSNRENRPRPCC